MFSHQSPKDASRLKCFCSSDDRALASCLGKFLPENASHFPVMPYWLLDNTSVRRATICGPLASLLMVNPNLKLFNSTFPVELCL